jgi:hypothetical protein
MPTPRIDPLPSVMVSAAAAAPAPILLNQGDFAAYRGILIHENRLALLAAKSERYDAVASGEATVRPSSGRGTWLLLTATALAFCGAGMFTGAKIK